MATSAKDVPQYDWGSGVPVVLQPDLGRALQQKVLRLADLGDTRKVALDIGRKHRNAGARKTLRQHLQRHRLAGARGAGDEAMPVRQA